MKKSPARIAVVGLGGLFPKSLDTAQFWNHVLRGADLISDVPDTHWKVSDYFDADPKAPDKTYAKRGGFLPQVPFDTLKEGIPPSLLASTDTSQLLGLLVARTALDEAFGGNFENAPKDKKERVSCLLGVTSGQELFGQMASRLRQPEWRAGMRAAGIEEDAVERAVKLIGDAMVPWTEATFPGLLGNVVPGRIANRLDIGGTNAVTDAACASSFAAISMGIDELTLGRADVVLTGGVDTLNDIFMHMCFSKTPALSASGDCRPFDKDADGTLLGEGVGMLALKRLEDAERDGNAIYAVIQGLGTSSDGRSKSVYAPVPEGQAKALRRAYDAAGYAPTTVELVEAHGTGTRAGDAAELSGLKMAFTEAAKTEGDARKQWCAVGSVKSQIGHAKAAAGAAGILKVALALSEKVIPPTLKVKTPNPAVGFEESPFYVSGEARPWIRSKKHPRRASVSSFGFGGSNFHIALEEYVGKHAAPRMSRRDVEVVALSGTSRTLTSPVALEDAADLAAWARSVNTRFDAGAPHRAAFVAATVSEAMALLDTIAAGKDSPHVFRGEGAAPKIAALFPGQGSQALFMGGSAAMAFDAAQAVLDAASDIVPEAIAAAFPPSSFSDADKDARKVTLTRTENAQPALAFASMAAWRALESLGVKIGDHVHMTGGHSFGELSALCAAGAMDDATLFSLARRRGELMHDAAQGAPGAMAAVIGDLSKLGEALAGTPVVVANENAPDQAVISGAADAVDTVLARLAKLGVTTKKLAVSTAFHSPLVQAACAPFASALASAQLSAPRVPVYANTTAQPHGDVTRIRSELSRQVGERVRFTEMVTAMHAAGARVFLEVGPGSVLTNLAARTVPNAQCFSVDVSHGLKPMMAAIARLCALGVPLQLLSLRAPPASKAPVATKTSVMLTGANYGKPAMPAPVAPAARPAPIAPPTPSPIASPAAAVPSPSASNPERAPARAAFAQRAPMTVKSPSSIAPASSVSGSFLDALRESQRATAEAHMAFQRTLADAHAQYLVSVENTQKALLSAVTGAPIEMTQSARVTSLPAPAPMASLPPMPAPVSAKPASGTHETANGHTNGHSNGYTNGHSNGHTGSNGHGHVNGHAVVVAPAAAVVAKPAAPVAVSAAASGASPRALLLDVVADKTGYPKDALADGMSLEADLGIDSIKRVEILGALKEKLPQAASLDALKLAQLKTLGEIADALGDASAPASAPPQRGVAAPAAAAAAAHAAPGALLTALLDVVADKTGYPKDALSPSMALEADLGVDSIKRVEILSALKEKVPTLPPVDAVKLAQLSTLGEIASALEPRPFT